MPTNDDPPRYTRRRVVFAQRNEADNKEQDKEPEAVAVIDEKLAAAIEMKRKMGYCGVCGAYIGRGRALHEKKCPGKTMRERHVRLWDDADEDSE